MGRGRARGGPRAQASRVAGGRTYQQLAGFDGYQVSPADNADFARHQAQFTGQFLIDREGIVRWINVECASEGLEGVDRLPSEEEVLAAARAL